MTPILEVSPDQGRVHITFFHLGDKYQVFRMMAHRASRNEVGQWHAAALGAGKDLRGASAVAKALYDKNMERILPHLALPRTTGVRSAPLVLVP